MPESIETAEWEDWQRSYSAGLLVIWPPDPVRESVNWLRQRHDPRSFRICQAHISLTPPFRKASTPEALQQIEAIAASYPRFELRYGPVNSFLPLPCVYLEVAPKEVVVDLHSRLLATHLFQPPQFPEFVPHVTISEFGAKDATQVRSLLDELSGHELCGSFECCSIALIAPDENFCFTVKRSFTLGCRSDSF